MSKTLLQVFENGQIDNGAFGHREHVQVAWEMLRAYPFIEAVARYSKQIRAMAEAAGAPQKFNQTVTLSFMSLIAEKLDDDPDLDFDAFFAAHPGLSLNPLKHWYSDGRLDSDLARRVFLMPDHPAGSGANRRFPPVTAGS